MQRNETSTAPGAGVAAGEAAKMWTAVSSLVHSFTKEDNGKVVVTMVMIRIIMVTVML